MQIILKQREIEAALRQYIATGGVSLTGKTVEIGFTAGRKESGLVADISIEDTNQVAEAPSKPVVIAPAEPVAVAAAEEPAAAVVAETADDTVVTPAAGSSLFG